MSAATIESKTAEAGALISKMLEESAAPCVTSSFQSECVVLVHMLLAQKPRIPVLFLETGYHFPETIEYRDRLAREWNLNLFNLEAKQSVADQESQFGILNQSNPTQCCKLRKVEPLFAGLSPYDTWFTALRRDQSPTRANLKAVEPFSLPGGKVIQKISPLADWTARDVYQYMQAHGIPELSLYDLGYTSIGCKPCTALPLDPNDPHSSLPWPCQRPERGIHIQEK